MRKSTPGAEGRGDLPEGRRRVARKGRPRRTQHPLVRLEESRTRPYACGPEDQGAIGYCSGVRQSYLAACTLRGIDAAIDCYGGGMLAKTEELTPAMPVAPIDYTGELQCPLLGLFGVEDTRPSPADTEKTRDALEKFGKKYEFHTYEGAGHAFFAVDRPNYRQAAAIDGWKKVFDFYGRYLR